MYDLRIDGFDLGGLTGRQLGEHLRELDRLRRRLEARSAVVVAEAERRQAYVEDGHATVGSWCRALLHWSTAQFTARARLGRLMRTEPSVAEALEAGSIGVAQAHELGRAHANPRCGDKLGDVIAQLLTHAPKLSFDDFRLVVRRWEMLADTDGAYHDSDAIHARRTASVVEVQGEWLLRANCGAAAGVEIRAILDRYCDAEWRTDWERCRQRHGDAATPELLERTSGQRSFDALHRMFVDAASTPPGSTPPEPLVNLVVDTATLQRLLTTEASEHPVDPRWLRCETGDGHLVPPADVLEAMVWGQVRRVVIDPSGTVIDAGRRRRLFTGRLRELVLLGSARCIWPGCTRPSSTTDADHRTEWHDAGETNLANGDPCCPRHNRHKSQAGYRVWRDPDGYWHHYRPDGTEIGDAA